uniref:Uncharacterized protein n=1 Tax=Parastrongyloides trichosuri TaxID=131310 RepID=A0A0N4Z1F9_PARTI
MNFNIILAICTFLAIYIIGIQGDEKKPMTTACKHYCMKIKRGYNPIPPPEECTCPSAAKTTVKPSTTKNLDKNKSVKDSTSLSTKLGDKTTIGLGKTTVTLKKIMSTKLEKMIRKDLQKTTVRTEQSTSKNIDSKSTAKSLQKLDVKSTVKPSGQPSIQSKPLSTSKPTVKSTSEKGSSSQAQGITTSQKPNTK